MGGGLGRGLGRRSWLLDADVPLLDGRTRLTTPVEDREGCQHQQEPNHIGPFPQNTLPTSRGQSTINSHVPRKGHTVGLRIDGGKKEGRGAPRSEEHTSELQSRQYLVCR